MKFVNVNTRNFQSLPSFLCIGAQKAATSWLWVMLRQHPDIWMPPLKEMHFFDHLYVPENRAWTHDHVKKGVKEALKWHVNHGAINLNYFKYLVDLAIVNPFTEEWYRFCYHQGSSTGRALGDITPEYSTLPEEGVAYVKYLLGSNLKLIYIIRNPIDRALSQLRMNMTRRGIESKDEATWLEVARDPVILQRGDYSTYIPRWEKHYPHKNILYLPYKMVNQDPSRLLASVEDHLELPHYEGYQGIQNRVHVTKETNAPQSCVKYIQEVLEPQTEFLRKRFGARFCENI